MFFFSNIQKNTNVKISSILQCQKIPEGIRIRLRNFRNFSPIWKQQKPIMLNRKSSKSKKLSRKKVSHIRKRGILMVSKNVERGTLLLWNGFVFHVRDFGCGCVQNEVLSSYGKSAQCPKSGPIA